MATPESPDHQFRDIPKRSVKETLEGLASTQDGLSFEEARQRLGQFGPNVLTEPGSYSPIPAFIRQFTHFLAGLLWMAALLAFVAHYMRPEEGMATLGWAIVGVILINAGFAFIQEYKAERAVEALHRLLPETAWVTRAGQPMEISRQDIVPGDMLLLEEGQRIPADARVIESFGMRVDNAALTGESHAKARIAEAVTSGHWLDLPNLIFAGTTIVSGHGRAVVFATGMRSEFGKIAHLTGTVKMELSPLQQEIVKVTRMVAAISLVMGAGFFCLGLWTGLGFWISAIFGIGIIVANVPEGLLPTVTLALAMGSQRMAKRNALIKRLASVETLGCTTVICTDKTGTLTENRMKVDQFYADRVVVESREGRFLTGGRVVDTAQAECCRPFFEALLHCHNSRRVRRPDGRFIISGDPTEAALLAFALEHGMADRPPLHRMGEVPFDPERKRMSTLHWSEGRLIAFTKGAPESVLPRCKTVQVRGEVVPMTADERAAVLAQSRSFAEQAYRVLAVAMREVADQPERLEPDTIETNLTFLGLVAMMDPPHREVPDAIAKCRRAGVRIVMITGDHPLTAFAIARKIGLVPVADPSAAFASVIEGTQLDDMTDEDLRQLLAPSGSRNVGAVFARMAPRHKMRVVSALKAMGEIVAVTGDGVNDAPALKTASIGIAMGITGTDVAKETADIILLDDNFSTIVNAIEEGRAVYDNVRKFTTYILASNVPEIVPFLGYGFLGMPLALTIPQVLAVDLGTDMIPALGLGIERPHPGVMDRPPRAGTERLLRPALLIRSYVFLGLLEAVIAMSGFFLYLQSQGWRWGTHLDWSSSLYREATTVTFAGIVLAQVANVFVCRSERHSVFGLSSPHPLLYGGVLFEMAILMLLIYTPVGHAFFGTSPLPVWIFGPLLMGALALLAAEEGRKALVRRKEASRAS
jgi:sodium/potassium-transporting ATPase subunit alpha